MKLCCFLFFSFISILFFCTRNTSAYSFFVVTDIHIDFSYNCYENVTTWCKTTIEPSTARMQAVLNNDRVAAAEYIEKNFGKGEPRVSGGGGTKCAQYARYGCDSGIELYKETIRKLEEEDRKRPFDALLVLGDIVGHAPAGGVQQIIQTIKLFNSMLQISFPSKKIVMTLGNGDFFPHYTVSLNDNWDFYRQLYQGAGFYSFLRNPEEVATFMKGGYYMTTLPGTKFTVFSLNSVMYSPKRKDPKSYDPVSGKKLKNVSNKFELADVNDPTGQFAWLDEKLSQITIPKSVFMLTHIPPTGDDRSLQVQWTEPYQTRFLEIMKKHQDKIFFMGFGHLHREEWRLFDQAPFYGIVHSSISPINANNAGIRRYEINGTMINDFEQFYIDIYQSNMNNKPLWLSYNWKQSILNPLRTDLNIESIKRINNMIVTDPRALSEFMTVRYGYYTFERYKFQCEITNYRASDYINCVNNQSNDGV